MKLNLHLHPIRGVTLALLTAVGCIGAAHATTPVAPTDKIDPGTLRMQPCAPDGTDSLYRVARELLNQGNYRNASLLFSQITSRHPRASCTPDALYWQAFTLYRIGALTELRQARIALETQRTRYPDAYTRGDSPSLSQRIAGALAQQGDTSAVRAVIQGATPGKSSCDREEMAVRAEALNALTQLDLEKAQPMMEKVLARRDECSQSLRKQVVFMLGRQQDAAAAKMLAQVVRTETDGSIRNDAILFLTRMPTDNTELLSDVLKNTHDPNVQQTVVRALAANNSPAARKAVRAALKDDKFPQDLRDYVLQMLLSDEGSEDQSEFLREMYPRTKSDQLKTSIVYTLGNIGGTGNQSWLLGLVKNADEPTERRTQALQRAINLNDPIKIAEYVKLYDKISDRELRGQLINFYAIRDESAATNKLMDIARNETDPQLLRYAIAALTGRGDPRTQQLLMEILERK